MSVKVKLNSKISLPGAFNTDGDIISLSSIKSHFMTNDFYLKIHALNPNEHVWKYDNIGFVLSEETLKKGNCTIDFNEDEALFTIDAEFILTPRSKYISLVKDPITKWAFGGVFISKNISSFQHDISLDGSMKNGRLWDAKVVFGGRIEEFSYEKKGRPFQEKFFLLNTEVS